MGAYRTCARLQYILFDAVIVTKKVVFVGVVFVPTAFRIDRCLLNIKAVEPR